jgi:acyl-homoserine lactone acylase PvdQ
MADVLRARAEAALPPVEGELRVSGLREPVEVVRDRWGVPHIYARNLHDLYFAQGFTVASERLFQLDFTARLANGRLSELLGDLTVPIDRFVRTVGWNRAGRRYTEQWDDLSWEITEAFAEGVWAWVDFMPAVFIPVKEVRKPNMPAGGTLQFSGTSDPNKGPKPCVPVHTTYLVVGGI